MDLDEFDDDCDLFNAYCDRTEYDERRIVPIDDDDEIDDGKEIKECSIPKDCLPNGIDDASAPHKVEFNGKTVYVRIVHNKETNKWGCWIEGTQGKNLEKDYIFPCTYNTEEKAYDAIAPNIIKSENGLSC